MATADLQQWQQSLGARVTLQADLTWAGAQDGYVAAGGQDGASPFQSLWWILEPLASHCSDCPAIAAASPYDPPWSTSPTANILQTTPGAGATECGAGCKCSLEYGGGEGGMQAPSAWLPADMPGIADEEGAGGAAQTPPPTPPSPPKSGPRPSPYGPIIPRGGFTPEQKAALDLYRLAELEWNAVRGNLAELPNFFTLANPNFSWERLQWDQLTSRQRRALQMALEAYARWTANAPDSWFEDTELSESGDGDDGAVLLYNPYPRQRGGRFGFGPGRAVSSGGSGGSSKGRSTQKSEGNATGDKGRGGGGGGGASRSSDSNEHVKGEKPAPKARMSRAKKEEAGDEQTAHLTHIHAHDVAAWTHDNAETVPSVAYHYTPRDEGGRESIMKNGVDFSKGRDALYGVGFYMLARREPGGTLYGAGEVAIAVHMRRPLVTTEGRYNAMYNRFAAAHPHISTEIVTRSGWGFHITPMKQAFMQHLIGRGYDGIVVTKGSAVAANHVIVAIKPGTVRVIIEQ